MRGNLAHRKDKNHNEITTILTNLKISYVDLHMVGNGCPDLLLSICNINILIEIKDKKGILTPKEIKFHEKWNGYIIIAKSIDEIFNEIIYYGCYIINNDCLIDTINEMKITYKNMN